jgi:PAS domain S-box-containing protein
VREDGVRNRIPSGDEIAAGQYVASRFHRLARRRRRPQPDPRQQALMTLVGSLPMRAILFDRDLRVLAISETSAARMSLRAQDCLGRVIFDLDAAYYEPFREIAAQCLTGETWVAHQARTADGPGADMWVRSELSPWRDGRGEIGGLISVSIDITDMVEALDRTKQSEQRLNIAVEIADLHVWDADLATGKVVTVGARESFFDGSYDEADMLRDTTLSIHPDDRARVHGPWSQAVLADRPFRAEYRINRSDDKEVWAATTIKLVRDEAGRVLRAIGAMQNVTAQKRAERDLVQAKEDAEAANRAKSAFLAIMGHEIRTPLNGVLGMAQAMAAGELNGEQRGRLEVIRQSGENLLIILNDLLDLSKIEAGKLELEIADFDLTPLMESVRDAFVGLASVKGVRLELEIDPRARGAYRGDPTRLRQILFNLISNALKFTEVGEVRLRVARRGRALTFAVTDTGIGIPAHRLPHLFAKFEQADASTTRRFGGTGLGLAICRDLATMMGGAIEARSEEGRGSEFRLRLALPRLGREAPQAEGLAEPTLEPATGLRVLAAEDNGVNQLVLRTLLQQAGVDPLIVPDGREALAAWRSRPWDLILMDVQMPIMDGVDAARAIRAEEGASGRARTPILALTANAMAHQIEAYRQAGMDGFIAKPVRVEELFNALQAVLEDAAVKAA